MTIFATYHPNPNYIMEKFNDFMKWFNRPAQVFNILGYIMVVLGLICIVIGIIQIPSCSVGPSASGGSNPLMFLVMGAIFSLVAPQLFFAISKVVKAAEKYLGE